MKVYSNDEIMQRKLKKEKIVEKIKLIIVLLISIIVLYNVSLIIQAIITPNKTPNCLGYKTFSIISGSMMPEIQVGDIVIIKEIPEDKLKVGDIISFRENTEVITHRIINIEEIDGTKVYTTKGDNNNTEDQEKVKYSNIEGKLSKKIPKIGRITIFLKNKCTLIVIMIIFGMIYMIDARERNKRFLREKKKEILNQKENL